MWGGPGVAPKQAPAVPRHESLAALRHLLLQAKPEVDKGELAELSVAELRDELLACNPRKADWVRQVNRVSLSVSSAWLHARLCVSTLQCRELCACPLLYVFGKALGQASQQGDCVHVICLVSLAKLCDSTLQCRGVCACLLPYDFGKALG